MPLFRRLILCLAVIAASACTPIVAKRGNAIDEAQLQQITVLESTREDVARILGTPIQTGAFDDKAWYYVGQRTEQEAFFNPEVKEQTLVTVEFTSEGKVASIRKRGAELAQNIDPVDRKTPTYGKELSIMQQLLGNLGKPAIPAPNNGK